ncbi:MAG TPA: PD-(D/E)XK nuclease family protein [Polaromonas sp.]|uniref:PD-(D/E)XK nuclease family protein n=1 Tax=Polaromonas sp. TaxID=1869339 RepID=UPI002D376CA2|nr:PD-(D/E)XK nuclease family protein [Polaromonas sp.]HYW58853.1 PD-(D/E)XK nuclease family protein [Polaromonas sp.]
MTAIVNVIDRSSGPAAICWHHVTTQLLALLQTRGVHASRAVVLLPYAQLMQEAKAAWTSLAGDAHFVPRFETTMNWATRLGAFEASDTDIRLDAARDMLTATSLIVQAGLGAQKDTLSARVVEAAWSLARLAAAVPPDQRASWGARMGVLLGAGGDSPLLRLEAALGQIALAWAANSSYPSDVLFSQQAGEHLDLLVTIEGYQTEAMTAALKAEFASKAVSLTLYLPGETLIPALHAAQDFEDEAERAAACVLAHLAEGRSPVGLIAQDRELTRRVRALLGERGVALRDETGWKLSTTRAAATLMGLLRALSWNAATDAVLDWLKNAPAFDAATLTAAEKELRRAGVRDWRGLTPSLVASAAIGTRVQDMRDGLQRPRALMTWLRDLRGVLQTAGQWDGLLRDVAGQAVLDALRLQEGAEAEFLDADGRMDLSAFTSWVNQTLEAASFSPPHPDHAQVIILPLSQLLGRTLQAVVLPGCDEQHLPVSPEPPGQWTPAQRELLGLPSREVLADAERAAWLYALRFTHMDLLWRTSENGERLMPSGFVQELLLQHRETAAPDPRDQRMLELKPTPRPAPTGEALPVKRLSASAYEDLRRCPYRFFALRQLKLQEADELDTELGKRDFGNWLHTVLKIFHDALKSTPTTDWQARIALIDEAAEAAARELALSDSEFLPFSASWPRVRAAYLEWLGKHEAEGATFDAGEVAREVGLGTLTLIGKIDRIDRLPDGGTLVIDYKTEASGITKDRLKQPQEDTQLAFYAGLLEDDTLAAAYVNLGEKEATRTYQQLDIVSLRDELLDSILTDMSRIDHGATMPAIGEGKACAYCSARGLCRKDFW